MRLNPIYTLQSIADEHFIFMRHDKQVDFTRIVSLNDSAAWLWTQLEKQDFTYDDAVRLVTGHYEVESVTASSDVKTWLESLKQNDLIQE